MVFVLFLAVFAPWGRDAGICYTSQEGSTPSGTHTGHLSEPLIRFHQEIISPADGPRSHFYPSSSQYTLDAFRRYGFLTGILMGCDRLIRENEEEWVYEKITMKDGKVLKWDPVK